ncbi:CLC_0170 family protein [Thermoanaerobacterium sp. DL9XJH110]|jgi:hypothetical protein|uniref:CLC_0170 family protein n=1 Tax=Thermoanaerobacterium sp. DL9XJH110 TaxID=3386643 RepID=UPI003BB77BF5
MSETLNIIIHYIKDTATYTTLAVFIASGLCLLAIDGADLETKNLKKQLAAVRVLGILYIFGSIAAYILLKYLL